MKQYILLSLNTLTLLGALIMNWLSGTGALGDASVGEISAQYETLFTPAGYAFAIWGLIYLLLVSFVSFQWLQWTRQKRDRNLRKTGIWFAVGNIANGWWIYAWLNEYMALSLILILVLLVTLIILVFRLRLEIWDAPLGTIAFVWWPICIYIGWIVVATVANFAIFLKSEGWQGGFLSETAWSVILIAAATAIYSLLIYYRNMREAALVGIWALIAIAVKQQEHPAILYASVIASALLLIYVSVHGYKNRQTSPFKKIQRREF